MLEEEITFGFLSKYMHLYHSNGKAFSFQLLLKAVCKGIRPMLFFLTFIVNLLKKWHFNMPKFIKCFPLKMNLWTALNEYLAVTIFLISKKMAQNFFLFIDIV